MRFGSVLVLRKRLANKFHLTISCRQIPEICTRVGKSCNSRHNSMYFCLSHIMVATHHLIECILDYCLLWYSRANKDPMIAC